ncbi:MAG: TrkH family potassium uptake protein [Bacteroidales bacterium]|nr:TrkH family potassium uptake protein [Bacteroidales bacterium]
MNLRTVSRNVGYALLVSALFMLLSVLVSFAEGNDSACAALIISFTITFIVGIFPFIFVRKTSEITLKEGYLIITLSWLLSFIFGMLPYALWGGPFTLSNAWFESVSGFTTTGATILENVEALPDSLLFWRASTHFIGGLGVVVFLLLLIPGSSPMRMKLTNMELSSLSKSGYSSRTNKTVYIFAYVYLGIGAAAFISYLLAGMPFLDAVCHAMSVCATGGFSTRNLSIAAFDSRLIEGITMVFMYLASIHFGLVFLCFVNRSLKPLGNPILKFYTLCLVAVALVSGLSLKLSGVETSLGRALWDGAFQTVSIASTTGFAIADNSGWPLLSNVLLMFMAVMCGCAGSTTGGIKADRVLVLFKSLGRHIGRILHPSSVNEIRLGRRVLKLEEVEPQILYIAVYCFLLAVSVLLALAVGVNGHSAFAASVSSLGNVGPAIEELGSMGNFNSLNATAKLLFTADMFLGRVEIYPLFAVVAMIFDGRRRK